MSSLKRKFKSTSKKLHKTSHQEDKDLLRRLKRPAKTQWEDTRDSSKQVRDLTTHHNTVKDQLETRALVWEQLAKMLLGTLERDCKSETRSGTTLYNKT